MTWVKGQSGNPAGRRPGTGEVARLRAAIAQHVPEIVARLVERATVDGDAQAARLLLERVLPPVKAVALPETVPLPADGPLVARAEAVLRAMASGEASPEAATAALDALGAVAKLKAIDEMEARLRRLEEASNARSGTPN